MTSPQDVATNLAQICLRIGQPLTPQQHVAIAGALSVWLEKARRDGMGAGLAPSEPTDVEARSA